MDKEAHLKAVRETLEGLARHTRPAALQQLASPAQPDRLFDGDDSLFKELVANAKVYFEYGCGASTRYVLEHSTAQIWAVDTSKEWAERTRDLVRVDDPRLRVKWVDVGPVGDYGTPLSYVNRHNFPEYAEWLWSLRERPDLVLIDGRFRVFSFLTTLQRAPAGTKVLFDDYAGRRQYHLVEEFSPVVDMCGRQALFVVSEEARRRVPADLVQSFRHVFD
jgi:hypothetical protein